MRKISYVDYEDNDWADMPDYDPIVDYEIEREDKIIKLLKKQNKLLKQIKNKLDGKERG